VKITISLPARSLLLQIKYVNHHQRQVLIISQNVDVDLDFCKKKSKVAEMTKKQE